MVTLTDVSTTEPSDLALMMTSTQVVETSVNVTTKSPFQDYTHPDHQTLPTNEELATIAICLEPQHLVIQVTRSFASGRYYIGTLVLFFFTGCRGVIFDFNAG